MRPPVRGAAPLGAAAKRCDATGSVGSDGQPHRRCAAEVLERQMALMLSQEVQETLVIVRRHVEQLDQAAVVASGALEAVADDLLQFLAREVPRHERAVDYGPERL